MNRILIALALVLSAAVAVPAVAHQGKGKGKGKRPDVIALPNGFQPEGIATGQAAHVLRRLARHRRHLQGQPAHAARATILVEGAPGGRARRPRATGLKVDRRGRLFVSGADSKHIRVYDARTGDELRDYFARHDAGFINDVIVTKQGAYFTDSNNPRLYFIPFGEERRARRRCSTIPLTGGDFDTDPGFNAQRHRGGAAAARR